MAKDLEGHEADHLVGPAVRGAIECALWTGTKYGPRNEVGDAEILSEDLRGTDVPADVEQAIRQDVEDFVLANSTDCVAYVEQRGKDAIAEYDGQTRTDWAAECIGHDFMLTRNGHGAGFWDRGLGELGDRLSKASGPYGEQSIEADEHDNLFLQ